MKNCIFYEPVI